jgi:hypothetical protein
VVLASWDIHMKKPRLKSLVSWANRFTWTYFLFALFSREEEGMMGGKADKHLPPNAGAHSFTRNRTRGSDFPPFFLRVLEVPTIVPPLLQYAFLAAGKDGTWSLDGYDFS